MFKIESLLHSFGNQGTVYQPVHVLCLFVHRQTRLSYTSIQMVNHTDKRRARGEICKTNPIGIPMEIINRNDTSNEIKHNVEERQTIEN